MGKKARKKERRKSASRSGEAPSPVRGGETPVAVSAASGLVGMSEPGRQSVRDEEPVSPIELAARLAGLSTVMQRHLARSDPGEGLTRARLSTLALLVLGGPRTPGELAAAEGVRPPTMTRMVRAMEADGLVERQGHPSDGRSIIISATRRGERALEQGRRRQIAPLAHGIAALEGAERQRLEEATELLGRLLRDARREPIGPSE